MLGILSEVLPSIGSVARLSISNRPKGTPHAFVMRLEGTVFDAQGWRFEIVDMDGRRIDRLLVSRPPVLHRQKTAAG